MYNRDDMESMAGGGMGGMGMDEYGGYEDMMGGMGEYGGYDGAAGMGNGGFGEL